MEDDKIIVVFGGSFNPPLNSHFSLAEQIISEYENVEKLIFVPVNQKYQKKGLLDNKYRYEMLKSVCDKNDKFEVSDIELKKKRQPYTIETLEEIQKQYPEKTIWFTTGSDNLKELKTWEKAEDLVKKFKILVLERDEDCLEDIIKQDKFLSNNEKSFIKVKNSVKSSLSSSFVRNKIKEGKSIRYFTPDEVYEYISTLINDINLKADILILAGGDHLYWYNNAHYKLLPNTLYKKDNQKYMIPIKMSDEYDKDALITSLERIKNNSDNPLWFDGSRAMKVITNYISHQIDAKYIIPTKINMEDGLKDILTK